jgi:hypothetical protein
MQDAYVMPFPGEVNYGSVNGSTISDDGVNLMALNSSNITKSYVVENLAPYQQQMLLARTPPGSDVMPLSEQACAHEIADVFKTLDEFATKVTLTIKPLTGGPFDTQYFIPTSLLQLPKTIDLEAGVVS